MNENALSAVADNIIKMCELPWFKKPDRLGYGITQSLTKGKDQSYKALMSASKGAISCFNEGCKDRNFPFTFVFPLVVVDAVLFESYLDESDKTQLIEIDSSHVHFRVPIGQNFGTTVKVVSSGYIDRLTEEIRFMFDFLKQTLAKQLEQAQKTMRNSIKGFYQK